MTTAPRTVGRSPRLYPDGGPSQRVAAQFPDLAAPESEDSILKGTKNPFQQKRASSERRESQGEVKRRCESKTGPDLKVSFPFPKGGTMFEDAIKKFRT